MKCKFKWNLKIVTALLPIMLLFGCEEVTIIDMGLDFREQLVVTGFIGADGQPMVFLQLAQSPLGKNVNKPEIDATVTVIGDNNRKDSLSMVSPNFFMGETFGMEGHSYWVEVSSQWGSISSNAITIPQVVAIDSIRVGTNNGAINGVRVFFNDPEGNNYYAAKTLFFNADDTPIEEYETPLLFDPVSSFRDDQVKNGRLEHYMHVFLTDQNMKELYRLRVVLYHLEPTAWSFFNTLKESEGSIGDVFIEPTIQFSNMSNGVGIFGGFATDTLTVTVEQLNLP